MNMQRRSFLTYLGVGWAASCFPLVLSACDTTAKKNETDPKVGAVGNDKVMVVRDPANKSQVFAVNPTCTHEGCKVKWEAAENNFECPCHDSHFAPDGKATRGPAKKPLATYAAKIEGDKVMVKLG